MGLALVPVILFTGTTSLTGIVEAQERIWFIIPLVVSFVIFFISIVAETNRAPFDLVEAEQELVESEARYRALLANEIYAICIFDVETIFLFPWAVMFDRLALFGFIEMMVFLAILVVGYVYVWNRGALDWA